MLKENLITEKTKLENVKKFIEEKTFGKGKLLFASVVGSHAYNINLPTSDIDVSGVYILEDDVFLGDYYAKKIDNKGNESYCQSFIEQINDDKNDIVFYELKRFMHLLQTNNPTILTLVNSPEDCIIYKHELFEKYIMNNSNSFLTKVCRYSFGGYAIEQIRKARGLNKKIVNPIAKEKKTIIDFCYVLHGYGSIPLKDFLNKQNKEQKFCGVVNIPNLETMYALFYDDYAHHLFSEYVPEKEREQNLKYAKSIDRTLGFGYAGIEIENSNDIRLSSISKGEKPIAHFSFNKNGYQVYCKNYKEYLDWVDKRNSERYENNQKHGKNYDSKNMCHTFRLLETGIDVFEGKGIIPKRENREWLLKVRGGDFEYDYLVNLAEEKLKYLDELANKSNLPENVDKNLIHEIILNIRKEFWINE